MGTGSEGREVRAGLGVKAAIVIVLAVAVGAVVYVKAQRPPPDGKASAHAPAAGPRAQTSTNSTPQAGTPETPLPRLVDLGASKCIPCKMMAPILEQLRDEYKGSLEVVFIDVWENPDAGKSYNIRVIPTQIFYDASGEELFRHEGFLSREDILSKWAELGVDLSAAATPAFVRLEPAAPDTRPPDSVCYMCDGDVAPGTRVVVETDKGDVILCSSHCYFILYSSLLDTTDVEANVAVTDSATGRLLRAEAAAYLYGFDDSGRPTIKAFADRQAAARQQEAGGGSVLSWRMLRSKELAIRCGFCDRVIYPEDAALVKAAGLYTWGCCPMCALGVAARTQKDIEVEQPDAWTGQPVRVTTTDGRVSSLEPETAVAWAGKRKTPDGKVVSAGCFKQAFFANESNLRTWVEQHPSATGQMISINDALAAKMKLTSQQISKACKIGECAPRP